MANIFADRVRETTSITGVGTYNLNGAVAGFQGFVAGIADGNTCFFCVEDGTDWEISQGIVTDAAPDTLSRTTILASSNAGAAVNWGAGEKNIFVVNPAQEITAANFASGTLLIFQQTAAPVGWTKETTHNNKSLRVVSGTAGSGGATAFTSVFGSGKSSSNYTLLEADMPSHTHPWNVRTTISGGGGLTMPSDDTDTDIQSGSTGGDGSHQHTLSLDLQYVDIILASKD